MEPDNNPAFVFIHGAWHNHHTWDKVVSRLAERGYASVAIDLPGAGANAAIPLSFNQRPLDPAAFGSEPSPNAGVSQSERNEAALAAVREARERGNGQVVLVGHSLGGLTLNQLGEAKPDGLVSLVYLAVQIKNAADPDGEHSMEEDEPEPDDGPKQSRLFDFRN